MGQIRELLDLQLAQGQAVLSVTGGSMHPLLKEGDLVRLQRVDRLPRRGDIALYQREDGIYILHRVIAVAGDQLRCCGDHQWQDEHIRTHQVAAIAVARGRSGSWRPLDTGTLWFLGRLWVMLYPVRRPLLRLRRRMGRLRKRLKRKG